MDFLQLFDRDFGVNGGGVQLLVSEQLLDVTDVGPAFEHVGGAGVAQQVATAFAVQSGLLHPFRDQARQHVGVERAAVAVLFHFDIVETGDIEMGLRS